MCIRDIYHHVSGDTFFHRAINRLKTAMQGVGQSIIDRCADGKHIFGVRHLG